MTQFSPFFPSLSLSSLSRERRSLLSPPFFIFSDEKSGGRREVLRGGGAVAGRFRRRRRRCKCFFFLIFFLVLSLLLPLLYTILNPKFTNKYLMSLDLNEKKRKESYTFLVFFLDPISVCMLIYGSVVMWFLEYGSV